LDLDAYTDVGMAIAYHASQQPAASAIVSQFGNRTFAELNGNANRIVRLLRSHGIGPGDAIAIISRNRPEFVECLFAALRSGIRITPINFHLTGAEAGYIVDNCDAKAFIADASLGDVPRQALDFAPNVQLALSCGGPIAGFTDFDAAISGLDAADIDDPQLGGTMLYTSGTTGRPKGVYRAQPTRLAPQGEGSLTGYRPGVDRGLLTGPAYHAAPLLFDIAQPLTSGAGIVMMNKWDAEETLALTDQHKITHTHMVATMFHRLLQLPEEVKAGYDLSSLRFVIHGAAPCPVHVKHAMIKWLGPILWEYYAATEGGGGFLVGSEEWLTKPGTVGRPGPDFDNKILNDDGDPVPPGTVGTIFMRAPATGRFEYYKDAQKTSSAYAGDYFTLGDMGYFDEDGYLFITGRTAELILSGGVNIYPAEVDSVLLTHPDVQDVCTVGVPNDEWGEEVKAVVQLKSHVQPGPAISEALKAWAMERLAHFKCPRSIDFVDEVPRSEAGKVQRSAVRARYL